MSALLLATAMAVAPPVAAPTHSVVPGESLTWIAECELGDANRVTELIELNGELISDPDVILPGWELVLPEDATGECAEPPEGAAIASPSEPSATKSAASESVASEAAPSPAHSHPRSERKADRQVRAQSASSSGRTGGGLASIRQCESGGDYGAVSANGKYRGAYQFDRQTWASVGGSGDPAAASPAEQDQRAQALQQQRGSSPWPSCG